MAHVNTRGREVVARTRVIVDCICSCENLFREGEMNTIFECFNAIANHELQNSYPRGCLEITRWENFMNGGERNMFAYKIKLLDRTVNVCQKFFLGLHGIGQSKLRKKVQSMISMHRKLTNPYINETIKSQVQKFHETIIDDRGHHGNHAKTNDNVRESIKNFILNLKARETHYSRQRNENKTFLPANTTRISLYKSFLEQNPQCDPVNNHDDSVKYSRFSRIFNCEFNISFGFPRSDLYDTCELLNVRIKTARRDNDENAINEILA